MSKLSRREFLENSMFAAAAAIAAGPITTAAAAAAPQSKSPNDRLLVTIVGVNGRGGDHIRGFGSRKDCRIAAIVDVDTEVGNRRADGIEKSYGYRPKVYTDLRKAYDDGSIDLVSIATPNHWHSLAAIWAMQAGKDVYVEKPVSHNVSEGRRCVEAARKYNKICQTGTQCRSMRGTIDAIEFVKAGKIGDMNLARGLCYKPRGSIGPKGVYQVPASVDYDIWCGPAPKGPLTRPKFHYDWHWQWPFGNGDLGNQGIHQMDIARWGLGVDNIGQRVLSFGGRFAYEDAGETANTQVCLLDYGDKRLIFEVRGLKTSDYRGAKVGVVFHGSDGYVVLTSYDSGAAFDKDGKMIQPFKGGGDHYGNFIDAVRSRNPKDLHADIEEGHLSSALCHLGNISYRLGDQASFADAQKQLEKDDTASETFERFQGHLKDNGVDLAKTKLGFGARLTLSGEEFTGEGASEANPMLTREYRAPYVVPSPENL